MSKKILIPLERPIAFHPIIAKAFGGINTALLVQQIHYWSDKGNRNDGFIYKPRNEIQEETFLSHKQQIRVEKKLIELGVLEMKLMKAINGAPTNHYRLNYDALNSFLMTKGDYDQREDSIESAQREDSNLPKGKKAVTESTTESTREYTSEETSQANEVVSLIDSFSEVNKTAYRSWYRNKTQRAACKDLIDVHGLTQVLKVVAILNQSNQIPYMPSITTPLQLRDSWSRLEAGLKKKKAESKALQDKYPVAFV